MTTQNKALWGETVRERQEAEQLLDEWRTRVEAESLHATKRRKERRETLLEALVFLAGAGCFYVMLLCVGAWR